MNMAAYKWNEGLEVPHFESGMLGYDSHYGKVRYVKNHIMEMTLKFLHFSRGRSSVKAHFENIDNEQRYEMFITDIEDILLNHKFADGQITGKFVFTKRGQNYGIKLLESV